jgi:hypothetical protein
MDYSGIWIGIKNSGSYGAHDFIIFEDSIPVYYHVKSDKADAPVELIKNQYDRHKPLKVEPIDHDRLRFTMPARKTSFYGNDDYETTNITIEQDYQRLLPTKTLVSIEEINTLKFSIAYDDEEEIIIFNVDILPSFIQDINRRLNRKGRFIILEKIENTLLISYFEDGVRDLMLPIKNINTHQITLYGFEKFPHERVGLTTE